MLITASELMVLARNISFRLKRRLTGQVARETAVEDVKVCVRDVLDLAIHVFPVHLLYPDMRQGRRPLTSAG